MAGLVPAIHVLTARKKDVDARHKAGHDELIVLCVGCYYSPLGGKRLTVATVNQLAFSPVMLRP